MNSTIDRPPRRTQRSYLRRCLVPVLLSLPFLGLAVVFLAPCLFPGPAVGTFTTTPPHPAEVGDRMIGPVLYTLDARAAEQWTFFDFSRGSVVEVPHQFGVDWDLA